MNLKIILLLVVIMLCNLATTVSAAIVSSTSNTTEKLTDGYADGYTLAGRYNDEFNQGVLDTSRWAWTRENTNAWWMSSWYLGMNITDTSLFQDNATSPLLLQNYGGEDITIISKQWFNPVTSAENAGIIIYADDNNFVNAQYFISGNTKKVIIQKEDDNVGDYTATPVTLSQPHYIKLVKSGTNYSLYYSNDKKTWTYASSVTQPDTMTKIGYVTGGASSNHPVYFDAFVTDNFITTGTLTSVFDAGFGEVINSTLFMYTNTSDSHVDGYVSKDNINWILLQTDMPKNTNFIIPPEIQNRTVYVRAVLRGTSTSTPILQSITAQSQITSASLRSDDFNSLTLNTTLWEVIDPAGDSKFTLEGKNTANAFLNINVPCCVKHAPFTTNNAPRIMQKIGNVDFEIEAKFQSLLTEQYQEQGFIIEESPGNYIRIEFNGDGTNLNSYAATFLNNKSTIKYNAAIHSKFTQPVPLYLRVSRSGDNWAYRYSYDGITWTDVTNFIYNMNVAKVGMFIGNENANASLTPTFTGNIDYFFNTASPIIPEDIPDTTPPVINVWYGLDQRFGHLGTPQTWINILGNVSDSSSAVVALNYSLNDGAAHQLVLGKDNLRLENTNDFNIEESYTNFTCGNNHIDLSASDSAGNVNNIRVNIDYSCGVNWLMPYTVDWSTVSDIQDVAQVMDGQWIIRNGKATPTPQGYDRIIAMGNMTWKNYTVTVPITLNSEMTFPGANFGIVMRWKEYVFWSARGAYPREGWYPLGAIAGYYDSKIFGGKRLALLGNNMNFFAKDTTATQLVPGSTYNFKASAQTVGTDQVFSLKVWEKGTGEPANWTVSANAPAGALTQGSILLLSYNSDVSFGNVAITNLDTQGAKIPPSSYPNGSYTGTEGTAISFDGSKSFDPDGSIVSYEWDFGDGNSGTGVNPTHIYAQNGTYTVSLKVTDNDGLNAINSTTAIIKTTRNTVTSFVNLIGNNNSEPIVLENQAEIDITTNNSSVSGYITLTVDTNITRLNGSVSIANSTSGLQTGEKALNRYVEVDSTGINKSSISSVNLTIFYSDKDISGFDENSLKLYWWNGSIWKSLYPKGMNYSNEKGPIVIDIRRNLTANKLTVQLNYFSTFALALVGTPSTTSTPPCNNCNRGNGGSGGGGGGGGGASGESYSNIELIEKYDMQISKDALTSYRFTHEKNPIMFVNITGNTNYGIITVSEEVLKGTSTLVKTSPEGLVYKNVNIWVGTSGFATPKNIKEASIKFRIDNNWMSANNVTSSDIVLVRWNGNSWIELETRILSKDDKNTFFEGKTIEFSPFAITVKMDGVTAKVPDLEIPQQPGVKAPESQPAETAIIKRFASLGISTLSTILIILISFILIAMYFKRVKK